MNGHTAYRYQMVQIVSALFFNFFLLGFSVFKQSELRYSNTCVTANMLLFCILVRLSVVRSINNGNRTEWSPIRSVIIRVFNKIGRPRVGSPIC